MNCNRSPTSKVYILIKKKPTHVTSTCIYSKQNIIFFICILQSYSWKITLYHSFPELKCLINIGHPAPPNCQFPHSVHLRLVRDMLVRYCSECADEAYCTALVDQKVDLLSYHCLQMSFLYNVCRNMSMRIVQRKQQMQQLCRKLSFLWLEKKIRL